MSLRISPSILAADFMNLADELDRISSADLVHVDIMDNHFVPNLTFGLPVVEQIQTHTKLPLDLHSMIEDPQIWAPKYADLGVFSATFHAESCPDPVALAKELRAMGCRAGLALKPGTAVEKYLELLSEFDQFLVMTVEPGFGGQPFLSSTMPKLKKLREAANSSGAKTWLQVDGGITENTIIQAVENGADTFVAGSSVFGAESPELQINKPREIASLHQH